MSIDVDSAESMERQLENVQALRRKASRENLASFLKILRLAPPHFLTNHKWFFYDSEEILNYKNYVSSIYVLVRISWILINGNHISTNTGQTPLPYYPRAWKCPMIP